MGPPSPGDLVGFENWVSKIDEWRGEVNEFRKSTGRRFDELGRRVEAIDEKLDGAVNEIAVVKTKVAFYAGIGSLVGGGIVAFIVAIAGKAFS